MSDVEDDARALLGRIEDMGEIGVVIYTDGRTMPVLCQRHEDLRPMLERVLRGLDEPKGTLH